MAKRYYESDGSFDAIKNKTVAIIGYGSQGHAHALNLRDSGCDVVVGLYKGSKSWAKAEAAGLKVMTVAEAAKAADIIMILVSDHLQADLYKAEIEPGLKAGKTLMFAHGFAIHFGTIVPPADVDVSMVAPEGAGPSRPRAVHRRRGRAVAGGDCPESVGQGARGGPRLRAGAGVPENRRHRNHFPRRDRERSVRRTGRPVRRRAAS